MLVALIPVKEFDQAKTRLAPVLDAVARRELAVAMFRDVLVAAMECDEIDRVAVVSRDPEALTIARVAGANGLDEPGDLNEALTSASQWAMEHGATRILVLASDLPLITQTDLSAAVELEANMAIALSDDGGTNVLSIRPGMYEFAYGRDSARRHIEGAVRDGLSVERLDRPSLALDIDSPTDLERLREQIDRAGEHTRAALERIGLMRARG